MRKYLATIHTKPEHHKKRFALAVSSGTTLLIFSIWFITHSSPSNMVIQKSTNEVTPLESLKASIGSVLKVLHSDAGDLKKGLETVHKEYGR